MTKKTKIPGIFKETAGKVPACEKCGEDMVRWKDFWVCNEHFKIPVKSEFGKVEEIPFGEIFRNRQDRRRKL